MVEGREVKKDEAGEFSNKSKGKETFGGVEWCGSPDDFVKKFWGMCQPDR